MLGNILDAGESQTQDIGRPTKRVRKNPVSGSSENGTAPPKDTTTSQSPEKETRSQKTLSCMECRRLKLKCDRVFPCQSCCKRGCSEICPEGVLISGRGSRFILANTEQLHEKITQLSDRVRQLEEALESLQSICSSAPHPLLSPELLRIKMSLDLQSAASTGRPMSPHFPSGRNDCAGSEKLVPLTTNQHESQDEQHVPFEFPQDSPLGLTKPMRSRSTPPEVPPDILQLSTTFPFPWSVDLKIRKRIRDSLPPRAEAQAICEEARRNALWQFNLDASETFLPNLLHHVYTSPIQDLSPRRLALLLMNLAIGSIVDLNQPVGSHIGEAYHHLARASVCEIPLMEEPDFDVLHALFYMIWYHLIFSDSKKAVTYAWNLMGFVAKLSQGLGLHRDTSRLKVIPEEHEKRRAVFWELLNLDCRLSLSLGRPPSLSLVHVDSKPPTYCGEGLFVPKDELIYHEWKTRFFVNCLDPILHTMIAVTPPDYCRIIHLDKAVRDFDIPSFLNSPSCSSSRPRFLALQKAVASTGRDIAILQIHRRYFMQVMSGPDQFDLNHKFSPSVIATYLGASSLISATESLFNQEPDLSVRFLHFWFNCFSGAVALCLLVSRAPFSPVAPFALQELDRVCRLFRRVAKALPFSAKALPVLEKLADKPRRIYIHWRSQHQVNEPSTSSGYREHPSRPNLPQAFMNVHPALALCAEQINIRSKQDTPAFLPAIIQGHHSENQRLAECLPDVYGFNSAGLGIEDRCSDSSDALETLATLEPHPFIPSPPRIGENEAFNLDFGALTLDLTDTSYMAWF